ncbi:MAG: ribonuclease III [Bacteroidia bacterium]|nr:ribonuclease III [Bacteroidia bacterium]
MLKAVYIRYFSKDKEFARQVSMITGFMPREIFLYQLALKHSSLVKSRKTSARECNERLEFLGDTILDSVISEYLFKIYPLEDEGFLTEMRSKIVNRNSLNQICRQLKLDVLIQFNKGRNGQVSKYMYGDALEAFIGAVYLDLGFKRTKRFVLSKIISNHIDLKKTENVVYNYKSILLEYVQKEKLEEIIYEVVAEKGEGKNKFFQVQVRIGEKVYGTGDGSKKKIAEQNASEVALLAMNVINSEGQILSNLSGNGNGRDSDH